MSNDNGSVDDILTEYLESISNLPSELSFNMSVLRSLDEQFHAVVESMRHNARSYAAIMKMRRSATATGGGPVIIGADKDARGALMGYRSDYRDALEKAEQKVDTSQRVLDQFNAHFNRLEKAISRLEHQQQYSQSSNSTRSRKRPTPSTPAPDAMSRKSRRKLESSSSSDEDQILYCICRQISYGDMVGCDNPSCPIEWFHYSCVGLVTPPKGKWYCSTCLDAGFGRAVPTSAATTPASSARKNRHKKTDSAASSFTLSSDENEGEVIDVEETGEEGLDEHGGRKKKDGAGWTRKKRKE
ncbi:hypothetical protein SpCBS45565_g06790 [Spizellomyces sp. 'palustris']|nr:hypothetical protein SpCBS45565_g06790 [Spizellomyces sp. 'palustris']